MFVYLSYCLKGMKHCILYILFFWIAVLIADTAKGNDVSFPDISKAEWSTEKEESAKLWEFVASNDAADISLQQHNPFSQNNSFRRNLHLRSLQAKIVFHLSGNFQSFSVETWHTFLYLYRNHYAQQKMWGYYIYGLCKIII